MTASSGQVLAAESWHPEKPCFSDSGSWSSNHLPESCPSGCPPAAHKGVHCTTHSPGLLPSYTIIVSHSRVSGSLTTRTEVAWGGQLGQGVRGAGSDPPALTCWVHGLAPLLLWVSAYAPVAIAPQLFSLPLALLVPRTGPDTQYVSSDYLLKPELPKCTL